MKTVMIEHHSGQAVPADSVVLGRWQHPPTGIVVTATLGVPPTIHVWWSLQPERGPLEQWYRATVQPALSERLLSTVVKLTGDEAVAVVVTPTAAQMAALRASNN